MNKTTDTAVVASDGSAATPQTTVAAATVEDAGAEAVTPAADRKSGAEETCAAEVADGSVAATAIDPAPVVASSDDEAATREVDESAPSEADVVAAQGRARQLRIVEALIFAAPGLVEIKEIARRLPAGADVAELVTTLEAHYAGRGVNVVRIAGKLGMRTAPDLAGALDIEVPVTRKLSRAAIETLAIIAYQHAEKKSVTRAEIEEIRGVSISKGTLDQLMEAGWIKPGGYREHVPGRPAEWITTDHFLEHFGLNTLAQLPGIEELRAAGLLDRRPGVSQYGEQGALELPPEMGEAAEAETGPVVDDDAAAEARAETEDGLRNSA